MSDKTVFQTHQEYIQFIKRLKSQKLLHTVVEKRLQELLYKIYPDSHSTTEVSGVLGGRNDLFQFFFNGRRVVFELFFSPSQVSQDLRLLEQSFADVKIAVLLDYDVNPKLADEYFRKKPDHFEFLWLKQVMSKQDERFCLARLKELIDENHVIRKFRDLLSTPAGELIQDKFSEQLEIIENKLLSAPTSQINLQELNGYQMASLMTVSRLHQLGIPKEKLRPLLAWLHNSIEFAFTLVSNGFQAFLITDLREYNAIWSDGDLADSLIIGAESEAQGRVVICLNEIVNTVFKALGLEAQSVQWHFPHTYKEFTESSVPHQKT
jgi:hypothetical protein